MEICNTLYIHIPFCKAKCPYCDFYSLPASDAQMNAYQDAVLRAIRQTPYEMGKLDTLYFGGGTPSLFGARRICEIIKQCRERFGISETAEITVECNPDSAKRGLFEALHEAGVNRISIGMQSVNDTQLKALGRIHSADAVSHAVELAKESGIDNISLDLMLATPGQTEEDIDRAVSFCAAANVSHVSAYLLKIEPGTVFAKTGIGSQCPDEDRQADLYLYAAHALEEQGFMQYEISNFAREKKVSRHNLKYWDCVPYLGIGPSAHSFLDGRRVYFPRDLKAFLQAENPFELMIDDGIGGDVEEYLMLRLRLNAGIRWSELQLRYPQYSVEPLRERAAEKRFEGLIVLDDAGIRLTREGMLVFNTVFAALAD